MSITGITETTPSAFGVEKSNRRSFVAPLLRMTVREIVYFCLHPLAILAIRGIYGIFRVTVPLLLLGGSPLPVGRVDSTSRLRFTATLKML